MGERHSVRFSPALDIIIMSANKNQKILSNLTMNYNKIKYLINCSYSNAETEPETVKQLNNN